MAGDLPFALNDNASYASSVLHPSSGVNSWGDTSFYQSTLHPPARASAPSSDYNVPTFSSLVLSQLITDNKTYVCPVCQKEIADLSSFKKHYTAHSGEKDYQCPACSYRTNNMSHLYRHSRTRHGIELNRKRTQRFGEMS